jgi:hypothetical protein
MAKTLPDFPDPASQPLAHTLAVYADTPDDETAIAATSNVYGRGVRTGLKWGDLRKLQAKVEILEALKASPDLKRVIDMMESGI